MQDQPTGIIHFDFESISGDRRVVPILLVGGCSAHGNTALPRQDKMEQVGNNRSVLDAPVLLQCLGLSFFGVAFD